MIIPDYQKTNALRYVLIGRFLLRVIFSLERDVEDLAYEHCVNELSENI